MNIKKIKTKIFRVIAGLLSAVTIFFSFFNAYTIPVQATEVAVAFTLTEELIALIQMYLASMGVYVTKEQISTSNIESYFNDVMTGATNEFEYYGEVITVDWSDAESIQDFYELSFSRFMTLDQGIANEYGAEYSFLGQYVQLDNLCYSIFGTSATEAIFGDIVDLKDNDGKVIGQAAWSDASQSGYIIEYNKLGQMLHNFNNNNGDDWQTKLKKFVAWGGLSLCLLAEVSGITNFVGTALHPADSVYTEYSVPEVPAPDSIVYDGFNESNVFKFEWTNTDTSGNYAYYSANLTCEEGSVIRPYIVISSSGLASSAYAVNGVPYDFYVNGYNIDPNGGVKDVYFKLRSFYLSNIASYGTNVPIFYEGAALDNYINTGDDTGCINKVIPFVDAYNSFLSSVPASVNYKPLINGISATNSSIDEDTFNELSNTIESIANETNTEISIGTEDGAQKINDLYTKLEVPPEEGSDVVPGIGDDIETPGDEDSDGENDVVGSVGDSIDYTGTLSDILTAIKNLPQQIFDAFKDMLETIDESINNVPIAIADFFQNPLSFIQKRLQEISDYSKNIYDYMQTIPDELLDILQWDAFTDSVTDGYQSMVDALQQLMTAPSEIIGSLDNFSDMVSNKFDDVIDGLNSILAALPFGGSGGSAGGSGSGDSNVELGSLFDIFIYLILILLMLIVIFMNCLKFIIMIFKIPATTGFLPDEMVQAIDFLKTLEIVGMNVSVYDFALFIIDMMIIFSVIKLLRHEIAHFKIPRKY